VHICPDLIVMLIMYITVQCLSHGCGESGQAEVKPAGSRGMEITAQAGIIGGCQQKAYL
jgi:hypothetical protein